MSEEGTQVTQEIPVEDSSPEAVAQREEEQKIETARAELEVEAGLAQGKILGKYESTEDLADAYQNLQREFNRLKNAPTDQSEPEPEPVAEAAEQETVADEQPAQPQIDPQQLAAVTKSVHEQAGGEQKFKSLLSWAKDNCSQDQINAYNEALNTGDQHIILNALKGIQYDYMMGNGYEPRLTRGRAPTQDVQGFRSRYEYQSAINDPRYASDPAYRKDVERKIGATPDELFGIN